jgi:hypothetical protein
MSFLSEKLSKLAAAGQPFSLTKWYLDTILEDHTILCMQIGQVSVVGVRLARVTVDFFGADGRRVSGSADALRMRRAHEGFSSNAAQLDRDRLTFQTNGISGELRFQPRHAPVTLRDPFLDQDGRQIRWHLEIPDADVTGTIRMGTETRVLEGRGYRDRVEIEFTPWGLPLRSLKWSRAVAGPHAAIQVEATTAHESFNCGWKDGVCVTQVAIDVGEPSRPLIVGPAVDLDKLHLGPLAAVLRKISRDPYQEKRIGPAVFDGCKGSAVQDSLRFRS